MLFFHHNSLVLKSYAKINVSLRIVRKLDNGYHELEMVFLPLALHDVIELTRIPNSPDSFITCDDIGLANNHHNLCMKALNKLRQEYGFKDQFNIAIHKEIPYAAGLGGGSSNAAVVLSGVNELLNLKASKEELAKIGLTIGADVPYFFYKEPALVQGIGEKITPFPLKKEYHCLLVKPAKGLSTTEIYEHSDEFECTHGEKQNAANVIEALQTGDLNLLSEAMSNDLYNPAKKILPEVEKVVNELKAMGLVASMMTGSGSVCFALSDNVKLLKEASKKFESEGYLTILTHTLASK